MKIRDRRDRLIRSLAASAVLVCGVLALGGVPARGQSEETGSLRGRILAGSNEQPLAYAQIVVFASGVRLEATADAGGRYRVGDVPTGRRLQVVVSPPDDEEVWARRRFILAPGENLDSFDIRAFPTPSVSGRVFTDDGDPVAGVEVSLLLREYAFGAIRFARAGGTRTNELGEYRLVWPPMLGAIPAIVWAHHRIRPDTAFSDAPPEPAQRLDALQSVFYPNGLRPEQATPIRLSPGEQRTGVDIELRRSPSLCAEGASNAGPGKRFFLSPVEPALGAGRSIAAFAKLPETKMDSSGAFRICGLTRGEYRITVNAGELSDPTGFGRMTFAIADEDIRDVRVPTAPRVPLPGLVVWRDEPPREPPSGKLTIDALSLYESLGGSNTATSEIPGEFAIRARRGLSDEWGDPLMDDYRVRVSGLPRGVYVDDVLYGGESVRHRPLRLGGRRTGAELRVVLAHDGGVVRVRAVDDDDRAVGGATVLAIPKRATTHYELADGRAAGVADHRGEYMFEALAPGDYLFLATPDDFTDFAVETIAALFQARLRAKAVPVGPNRQVDVTVKAIPLTR